MMEEPEAQQKQTRVEVAEVVNSNLLNPTNCATLVGRSYPNSKSKTYPKL